MKTLLLSIVSAFVVVHAQQDAVLLSGGDTTKAPIKGCSNCLSGAHYTFEYKVYDESATDCSAGAKIKQHMKVKVTSDGLLMTVIAPTSDGKEQAYPLQSCPDDIASHECTCAALLKAQNAKYTDIEWGFDTCNYYNEGNGKTRTYATCSGTGFIGLNFLIGFATSTFFWMLF